MADLANLRISVDSRDVKKAQDDLRSIGYTASQTEGATNKMSSAFGALKGVLGGLSLALVVREFVQMADSVALLEARIKSVTPAGADLANTQKQLVGIAKENMVALDAIASLYTKLAKPIRALGGDTQTTLNITSAFTKALKIGGASAQEASSAILQFGQAMASGVLRGDEFNSIAEASPRILQAIADGSGIAAGSLRKLAADGELTAGVIGGALLSQMVLLEAEAMRIPQTVDGAFTNFKTDLALVASEMNKNLGITNALISVFSTLSSTVGALGSIAASSIGTVSQFMRENAEIVTIAGYAYASLVGAMLSLAVAARVAAIVTMLSGTITGLVAATLAARLGFVAMTATMGIMPAIFFAVRVAALALYAALGPLGWAMAAVGAAAAVMATRYVSARQKMAEAQKQTADYTEELGKLEKRIKAVGSGDVGKVKALDNVEQLEQYRQSLRGRYKDEGQINNLVAARARLQQVELKQAADLERASAAQAKVPKVTQKTMSEAERAAKAAAKAREDMEKNIVDLETQLELIKAGTTAEEARTRVQLARQGASAEQITKILGLTKELGEEEKKTAAIKLASDNNKAANDSLALIKQEIALLDQGYSIAEAGLRLQLAKTGVTQEQINQIVAETAALNERKKVIEDTAKAAEDAVKAAEDAQKAFDDIKIDINFDALFGDMGKAMGGVVSVFDQMLERQEKYNDALKAAGSDEVKRAAIQQRNARLQINQYANLVGAAKGFFKQGTTGYKAMETAEKAFRLLELVMAAKSAAVKIGLIAGTTTAAVAGAATETAVTAAAEGTKTGLTLAGAAARIPVKVAEGAASMFAALGPLGFAAVAAMVGVMAAFGFSGGGGSKTPPKYNTGTGTVMGDTSAQSESLVKSIERLADIDRLTMRYSAQMASSLKSIEANIGGLTSLLVRTGDISASGAGIKTGTSGIGDINKTIGGLVSKIPVLGTVFGGLLSAVGSVVNSLFGTKTSIIGQGLTAVSQTMGEIVSLGFEAQNFTNVQKKSKFLGITTGTRYSTQTTAASDEVNRQFTLILDGFYDAITAASNPLGLALDEVQGRLNGFVVNIGQIDLKGLTGQEIQEKLTAVFGAAADNMARAAITGLDDFQKVGEGYFETVVRVASGVEQAQQFLSQLGVDAIAYTEILNKQGDVTAEIIRQSILLNDASAGIAGGFAEIISNAQGTGQELYELVLTLRGLQEQISATGQNAVYMTTAMIAAAGGLDAFQSGLQSFYDDILTDSERSAIELSKLTAQFQSLGVALPESKDAFKALIQSIDVTTAAGQSLYGSLIALTPAFVDFIGTTNAAGEQVDLTNQRRQMEIELLEAQGFATEALAIRRRLELAAMDESLRSLQEQIYAAQDAKAAADAAAQAAKAAAEAAAQAAKAAADEALKLATQRTNLEIALMEAQGDAAGALAARRQLELAAMNETLGALQSQIYAAQDLKAASEAAAQAARAAAEETIQIAQERARLDIAYMQATGDAAGALAAQRAQELAVLDESNRALQELIYAEQDAAAARDIATRAAEEAARAAEQRAQERAQAQAEAERKAAERLAAAAQLANDRRQLEIQLMEAQGLTSEALAARRAIELAGMDASLRGLQQQIYAAEDAREASLAAAEAAAQAAEEQARLAEEALALARDRRSLEIELLKAQGFAIEALTLRRAMELEAIDESLRGIQEQIWAAQAKAEADALAVQAAEDAAKALQDYADALANVSQTVIDEINRLRGINVMSSSSLLKAQFATLTAQARTGNLDALGKLPELSRSIEEATLGTATSALEVARIRAWLAASLSETLALQGSSDSMVNATSAGLTFDGNSTASANADQTAGELSNMSNVLYNALYQVARNTGKSFELLDRWDGDGLPDIREDASDYY